MNKNKIAFLPFNAINEFMKPDFRETVIRSTLLLLPNLPDAFGNSIDRVIKKHVHIPGFKNSNKAPLSLKLKYIQKAFEESPELVVNILSAWVEGHPTLRENVYSLLVNRNWKLLPIDSERVKLPGFFITWPKGEDFDTLNRFYRERYPEDSIEQDNISLMIVWLAYRLPYEFVENLFEKEASQELPS